MLLSEKKCVRCPGSAGGRGRNEGAAVSRWGAAVVVVEMVRGCCRYAMWQWVMVVAVMSQEAVMGGLHGAGGMGGGGGSLTWGGGLMGG
ncbi:hypothetical protein RAC83_001019 [Xylella fastidiosa]|uniref:hypothetical protein n=1 Tax=Xylella fastidiosa TaxID=2371 RepID=UPI0028801E59|nr:hypothetical protein [Xylella fastidiosa]MDS9989676.1 hypothetical protein [Xylella fastidiosa]